MAGKKAKQTAAEIEAKAEAGEAAAHQGMMIGVVAAGTPRDPLATGYQKIDVRRVAFDGNNHRSGEAVGRDSIEAFAQGIASTGLLHPIGVVDDPTHDRLIVAYGERRFRAALHLGWTEIDAKVYPAGTPIEAVRASENIDRTNLSPIEECLATGRVIEECGNDIEQAATRLGKDPRWVRDRQYILRLSGDARKLVQEGYLPLHYAREIAKVADPVRRNDLAERAVGTWALDEKTPGVGLERFEKVRQWVNESMYSLAVVPWETDVAFGGGPACNTCPSNTANDPKLFEADPDNSPEKAHCMNPGCFGRKQKAAEAAANAGLERVKRAAEAAKKDNAELTVTATGLANLAPKGIKESTFVRKAQQLVAPKEAAAADKRESAANQKVTSEQKARMAFDQAVDAWKNKCVTRLWDDVAKVPAKAAAFALLDVSKPFDGMGNTWQGSKEGVKAFESPAWRKLVNAAASADGEYLRLVGKDINIPDFGPLNDACHRFPDVIVELGKAFGIDLPPIPRVEEYMPKGDEPKAAAKVHEKGKGKTKGAAAAKKPAGKKMKKATGKKPAKRKAGAK